MEYLLLMQKKPIVFILILFLFTGFINYSEATVFYRAKCKSHGYISNWHYNKSNAEIAKKHHEAKWSTRGELDPNHAVSIVSKSNNTKSQESLGQLVTKTNINKSVTTPTEESHGEIMTSDFNIDDEMSEDKLKFFKTSGVDSWYHLKCPEGHICCRNCTADGDPAKCSKTKFTNCRECGHASNKHYAIKRN